VRTIRIIAFLLLLALTLSSESQASPFYRDIFTRCGPSGSDDLKAVEAAGWQGIGAGNTIGQPGYLKVNTPGSPRVFLAINSDPVGTTPGALFFPRATRNLLLFTDEVSFDIGTLTAVEYDQRLSGRDAIDLKNNGTRLAFLINNVWYFSDKIFRMKVRSVWETVAVDPHNLTYGTSAFDGVEGPPRPTNSGIALPDVGTVTAFGLFLNDVEDRVRIDNFTLSDDQEMERNPGPQGSLDQCPSEGDNEATPTPEPTSTPIDTPTATPTGTTGTVATSTPTPTPTATATPTGGDGGTTQSCTNVANVSTKGVIDANAETLSQLTAEAAESIRRTYSRDAQQQGLIRDALRARKKADDYVKAVRQLLIQYPEVSKLCPEAPLFCSSIDRSSTFTQLDSLYLRLISSAKRFTARAFFNKVKNTAPAKRNRNLKKARLAFETGRAALLKLPRVETVCK